MRNALNFSSTDLSFNITLTLKYANPIANIAQMANDRRLLVE